MDQSRILGVKVNDPAQLTAIEAEMMALAQRHGLEVVSVDPDEVGKIRQQLESETRAKFELIARLGHMIRTALSPILGYSEMLLDHAKGDYDLNRQESSYLEKIHYSGLFLLNLMNDLLDFGKMEGGNYLLNPETFKIADLVPEKLSTFYRQGEATILASYAADVDEMYSDQYEVRQILWVALKFASVASDDLKVGLTVTRNENDIKFQITALGTVCGKRAESDFDYVDWILAQRRCELLRGTLEVAYDDTHLEITLRLPAHLDQS